MTHSELARPAAAIAVLRRHGLYTKKSLGQHLLVDDRVVGRILSLAGVTSEDVVLEVGPGIGTLTVALAEAAAAVVAVETDSALLPVLAETTSGHPAPVRVVNADAVTVPLEDLAAPDGRFPTLLVANLPYAVAATVVLRFLQESSGLRSATVMVQAEVADRMTARPGTKAYGSYTVKLGLVAEQRGRFKVGPASFLPPPRVDSAVVRFDRRRWPDLRDEDMRRAALVADAAFSQRRKILRNSLAAGLGATPADIETALAEAGVDPSARAETLAVATFVDLARVLGRHRLLP